MKYLLLVLLSLTSCAIPLSKKIEIGPKNKQVNIHKPITVAKHTYVWPSLANGLEENQILSKYSLDLSFLSLNRYIDYLLVTKELNFFLEDSSAFIDISLSILGKEFKEKKRGFKLKKSKKEKCKQKSVEKRFRCIRQDNRIFKKVFDKMEKENMLNLIIPVNVGIYLPDESDGRGGLEPAPYYFTYFIFNKSDNIVYFKYKKLYGQDLDFSIGWNFILPLNFLFDKSSLRFLEH